MSTDMMGPVGLSSEESADKVNLSWVSVEEVDQNTLALIIQFIVSNYQPPGQTDSGDGLQFAMAINVPRSQCGAPFDPNNFLSGEDAETVKKDLEEKNLYQGPQMIAATPKGHQAKSKIHAERALIMGENSNQGNSPLQNLLNKDPNGFLVFYTYNSPCLDYCLNQAKDDNEQNRENKQNERNQKKNMESTAAPAVKKCILKSLRVMTNHRGPKAFVFSRVYRKDLPKPPPSPSAVDKTTLLAAMKEVAELVPLYKCDASFCVRKIEDPFSERVTLTLAYIARDLCLELHCSPALQTALQNLLSYPVRDQSRPLKRRFVTSPESSFLWKRNRE